MTTPADVQPDAGPDQIPGSRADAGAIGGAQQGHSPRRCRRLMRWGRRWRDDIPEAFAAAHDDLVRWPVLGRTPADQNDLGGGAVRAVTPAGIGHRGQRGRVAWETGPGADHGDYRDGRSAAPGRRGRRPDRCQPDRDGGHPRRPPNLVAASAGCGRRGVRSRRAAARGDITADGPGEDQASGARAPATITVGSTCMSSSLASHSTDPATSEPQQAPPRQRAGRRRQSQPESPDRSGPPWLPLCVIWWRRYRFATVWRAPVCATGGLVPVDDVARGHGRLPTMWAWTGVIDSNASSPKPGGHPRRAERMRS